MENLNNNLPGHWEVAKLGNVFRTTSGGTPSRKHASYYNGNIPWVKSGELESNVIVDTEEKITEQAIKESSAKIFPKGTLLIALYGANIGKLAILGINAATNQAVCGIYENPLHDTKYLYWFLFYKRRYFIQAGIGGAQPNISQGILKDLQIAFPPLSEQKQIASKIEELVSDLDNGRQQFETVRQQLKVYRQSLLKRAFEGRLTNKDVKEGELLKGWFLKKLGDVSETRLGKMLDKSKNVGSYEPYLRNVNVRWNEFNLENLFKMRFEEKENERYSLEKGDLIICEGGEPGRAAIWDGQIPNMKIQKALHRVRFHNSVMPQYFLYYLNLIASTKYLDSYFTGTTIKHLTGQSLIKIPFPCAPIGEQRKIVEIVDYRFSICQKMEDTVSQCMQQAESLRQSILKKAFEGKLVHADKTAQVFG